MQISAVIITKNEELNIERCIKSIYDLADEVIVVDSYSTDETKEICARYPGVRFEQRDWKGYSETKNFANSLANGDYILSLDADEEVSKELKKEIIELKNQLNGKEAYYLNRLTNYCGKWIKHSGWLPDYQLRLFPKTGSQWDSVQVHESIILESGIEKKKLKGFLNHYSYYTINEHLERAQSYTSLGAQKVLDKGEGFLLIKSIVNPFLRFIKTYFLKLGILDGYYGFCISMIASFTVFLKYFKAWQAKKFNTQP